MKKIIIIMISMTLSMGAFAQHKTVTVPHRVSPRSHVITRVYVPPVYGFGFNYGYPYLFGYPYFGFYPNSYYSYMPMSSFNLNRQITSIRSEYSYKIKAVRRDKEISKAQRKNQILVLKSEREKAIASAEKDFHQRRMNYRQGLNNGNNMNKNGNQGAVNSNSQSS